MCGPGLGSQRPGTGERCEKAPLLWSAPWERHVRWSRSGSGRIGYREAWARQKALLERRAAGEIDDRIVLLEHDPVLTLGRQSDERHVLAGPRELRRRGIEVIRVERGGEVTYHGPGQLVAYPIIRLADRGILVRPLVAALEAAMIETCARLGVTAMRRDGHPGCWIEGDPAATGRTARSARLASGSSAASATTASR